jgi:hypothetical protein
MPEVTNPLRQENWTWFGPVVSRMSGDEIESLEDRAMATIADRAPLGLGIRHRAGAAEDSSPGLQR